MSDLEDRAAGANASFVSGLAADAALCLRFFSRLPLPRLNQADDPARMPDFTRAARAVPLAGTVVALPAAILLMLLHLTALPLEIQALGAVLLTICITGGLHEDGLADVADGFFGGSTRERRLEIMKDSRIGAFGAIALVTSLLARTLLIAALIERWGPLAAGASLIAAEAASRTAMVWLWRNLAPARADGLGASFGRPDRSAASVAAAIAVLLAMPLGFFVPFAALAAAILLSIAACTAMSRLATAKIGGQTGDVLGAMQQVALIAILSGLTIVA